MNCFNLIFFFSFVIVIELVFSAPYSKDEFEAECNEVRDEMKDFTGEEREEKLIERLAKARCQKIDAVRKQGEFKEQKDSKDDLIKAIAVAYYLRIRVDRLQWLLTEDPDVRNELRYLNIKVTVPPAIPQEGKFSYQSRYRTWRAIMNVMQWKQTGYVKEVKNVLQSVGLPWNDVDQMAGIMAKFFNHLSSEVKTDGVPVEWENEDDIIRICEKKSIKDVKELAAVRALYRLNL